MAITTWVPTVKCFAHPLLSSWLVFLDKYDRFGLDFLNLVQVNDINFENMSNDDAVRVLRDIVHKPGWAAAAWHRLSNTAQYSCAQHKHSPLCLLPGPLLWLSPSAGTPTLEAASLCPEVSVRPSSSILLKLKSTSENTKSCLFDCRPCIYFNRRTNPTHWPSCVGVPHGGHDRSVPSVWHEPFHEHRHLHQLLYQQLHPRDWTWVPPHPPPNIYSVLLPLLSSFDSKYVVLFWPPLWYEARGPGSDVSGVHFPNIMLSFWSFPTLLCPGLQKFRRKPYPPRL